MCAVLFQHDPQLFSFIARNILRSALTADRDDILNVVPGDPFPAEDLKISVKESCRRHVGVRITASGIGFQGIPDEKT